MDVCVRLPPVATGQQRLCVGDQVADAHARLPGITTRIGVVAPRGYGVREPRNNGKYADNVAILGSESAGLVDVRKFQCLTRLVVVETTKSDLAVHRSAER